MAVKSIFENKGLLKESLMKELQAYRNFSTKVAVIAWVLSFTGHYAYTVFNTEAINVQVDESLYNSFLFSLVFALAGYCTGSLSGAHMQRTRLNELQQKRKQRKRYIEEQIAIRQAKLGLA